MADAKDQSRKVSDRVAGRATGPKVGDADGGDAEYRQTAPKRNSGEAGEGDETSAVDEGAPGEPDESAYPNDSYWQNSVRSDPKQPPEVEPDTESSRRSDPASEKNSQEPNGNTKKPGH